MTNIDVTEQKTEKDLPWCRFIHHNDPGKCLLRMGLDVQIEMTQEQFIAMAKLFLSSTLIPKDT